MRSPASFSVGQRLTDFASVDVTVARVASGGFGVVAMGPDQANGGNWSALKTLRPDLLAGLRPAAQQRLRSLFLRESLTWCGLWPHPNLLLAEGVTEIDGQLMLILDYAEQGNLRELFMAAQRAGKWLSTGANLQLAQHIAAGLVALHTPAPELMRDDPIIHRDLKPENILLDQDSFAMITDFGLAKAVSEAQFGADDASHDTLSADAEQRPVAGDQTQAHRTQRGVALGTPAYIAPEQWEDAALVGRPADAYAYGIILAELFSSRHPLLDLRTRHSQADWRAAHTTGHPIPLRTLGADVFARERAALPTSTPQGRLDMALIRLERLVARLLAKLPHARPSLNEALAELQTVAQAMGNDPYTPLDIADADTGGYFWLNWAITHARFGHMDEALARIERAREIAPLNSRILCSNAAMLNQFGRPEEALDILSQAQAVATDSQERKVICHVLGFSLQLLQRHAEAEQAYAEALTLMPDAADSWYNRASNLLAWAQAEAQAGRNATAHELASRGVDFAERAAQFNPGDARFTHDVQVMRRLRDSL